MLVRGKLLDNLVNSVTVLQSQIACYIYIFSVTLFIFKVLQVLHLIYVTLLLLHLSFEYQLASNLT